MTFLIPIGKKQWSATMLQKFQDTIRLTFVACQPGNYCQAYKVITLLYIFVWGKFNNKKPYKGNTNDSQTKC